MTKRERLYPEIKRLRLVERLTWREIGERLGLSGKTVCDYYFDPSGVLADARKKKSDENTRMQCPKCGGAMGPRRTHAERCADCFQAEKAAGRACRDDDFVLMWNEGMSLAEIKKELGFSVSSNPPEMSRLMAEGRIQARREGYRRKHETGAAA